MPSQPVRGPKQSPAAEASSTTEPAEPGIPEPGTAGGKAKPGRPSDAEIGAATKTARPARPPAAKTARPSATATARTAKPAQPPATETETETAQPSATAGTAKATRPPVTETAETGAATGTAETGAATEPAETGTATETEVLAEPVAVPPAKRAAAKKAAPTKAPIKKASPAKKATSEKKAAPARKAAPVKKAPPPAAGPITEEAVPESTTPVAVVADSEASTARTSESPADSGVRPGDDITPVTPLHVVAAGPDGRQFDSIAEQLLAEPTRTPEILAHALVQALGPRARAWADHARSTYPTASREALSRLAVQRFTRSAGLRGGVGALAGPYAPIALGAATVITHAELVLHLAAVHGLDPAGPDRAADLLRLVSPGVGPVAGWAALSLATPAVRLLAAFLSARTTTEMVAVRARRYYSARRTG